MKRLLRSGVMVLICAMALIGLSATAAFAGQGYGAGAVAGESSGGGGGAILPFTGADMMLYGIVGGLVLGSGLALRGYTARRTS